MLLSDPEGVLVQPRGHALPVGVREGGVRDDAGVARGAEPVLTVDPVVDRPRGIEAVEGRPHLALDAIGHDVHVDVDDAGHTEVGEELRDVAVVLGWRGQHRRSVTAPCAPTTGTAYHRDASTGSRALRPSGPSPPPP